MNRLRFQMIIYRFQVIQTFRYPSLSIFILLEPYGVSIYIVHHTLNRNVTYPAGNVTYTAGKRNPLPFDEKISLINRSTNRAQTLANQHFFPFKTNGKKCDFEYPIHGIINSCEIEGAYFGRGLSIFFFFLHKKIT